MRDTYWIRDITVILIGACAMLFVSGADRKLDKADQATVRDTLRIHCADQPHDAMCLIARRAK